MPLSGYRYSAGNASEDFRYAHSSDFLRLEILHREGGVYADMDTLFVRPYPSHLFCHPFVMGHETVDPHAPFPHKGGSLCNALFFCTPGSLFADIWRSDLAKTFDGTWSRHSTFLPFELSRRHPNLIHVEPNTSFFYLDWTRDGIQSLFEDSLLLPENVYSLHLWAHLWSDRTRTDVTRFHQGRLTATYVRHAQTTYARYARAWLPEDLPSGTSFRWRLDHLLQQADDLAGLSAGGLLAVARQAFHLVRGRSRP